MSTGTIEQKIGTFFQSHPGELGSIVTIAEKIQAGIRAIAPFIEQNTALVCPDCARVCCSGGHAAYSLEDLVYVHALRLQTVEYEKAEADGPCPFLSTGGCRLGRDLRPSGCNWYFCGPLYDSMESQPADRYREFDDSLKDLVELWMGLIREFAGRYQEVTGEAMLITDLAGTSCRKAGIPEGRREDILPL